VIERDLLFLEHVRDAIERIERFTSEGRTAFMTDDKTQSAVIRQLEIIGEATKRLSEEFRRVHPDLPWREMAATRDRLVHGSSRSSSTSCGMWWRRIFRK
jgi:uncharacterized protein with HEPN domain